MLRILWLAQDSILVAVIWHEVGLWVSTICADQLGFYSESTYSMIQSSLTPIPPILDRVGLCFSLVQQCIDKRTEPKVLTKMGYALLSLQFWYEVLCDRCNVWEGQQTFHKSVSIQTVVISTLKIRRGEYNTCHMSLCFGHNVLHKDGYFVHRNLLGHSYVTLEKIA